MPNSKALLKPTRQQWMAVLSMATAEQVATCVEALGTLPDYSYLRPAETGLTMVRGRAGGTGQVFNLGEMTLTRCVITLGSGEAALTGFGYVAGRNKQQAEWAAVCDALMQHPDWHERVYRQVIDPLQQIAIKQQTLAKRQTEATRVNFFTLLRGE